MDFWNHSKMERHSKEHKIRGNQELLSETDMGKNLDFYVNFLSIDFQSTLFWKTTAPHKYNNFDTKVLEQTFLEGKICSCCCYRSEILYTLGNLWGFILIVFKGVSVNIFVSHNWSCREQNNILAIQMKMYSFFELYVERRVTKRELFSPLVRIRSNY